MGRIISKQDMNLLSRIEEAGYIFRDTAGTGWLRGKEIASMRLSRLIEQGLLVPSGDSLFGTLSQTWKVKSDVQENEAGLSGAGAGHDRSA